MMKWLMVLASAGLLVAHGASANTAEQDAQLDNYGLSQTQVDGVTITRGRAYRPVRDFPSNVERQRQGVNLSRNYRGTVFGKHKIIRGGKVLYRDQLLPIRQTGDE